MIHLVEMKFAASRYNITKDYATQLRERRQTFIEDERLTTTPVFTFVTPYGLTKGINSSLVHSEITAEHLFASVK